MRTLTRKPLHLGFVAMFAVTFQTSSFGQGLVCVMDLAAGLAFDKVTKEWKSTTFAPKEKFVVSKSTNPNAKWEIKALGSSNESAWCKDDYSNSGQLTCTGIFQNYYINRKSLRFIHTYYAGYWNEESASKFSPNRVEGNDTPMVAAGTCTPI